MIDAIHVGDYKTGTTWLQQAVFRHHPGVVYVDEPRSFPAITRLFYELVDASDVDFDEISLRERFAEELSRIDRNGRKLVVSREALCGHYISGQNFRRTAERLYRVFGATKVLIVIREQFSLLASIYSEYVKMGGTLPLEEFIWDPFAAGNILNRLQHHKRIEALTAIFGADNVRVMLYEELKVDRRKFLSELFSFIGCDTGFEPAVAGIVNPGLMTVGAAVQRVLNRFVRSYSNPARYLLPLDKAIALFLSGEQKDRLLQNALMQIPGAPVQDHPYHYLLYAINMALSYRLSRCCESIRIGHGIEVSPRLRARLAPMFAAENRLLAERYGMDLERYGWSL